jgi:aldose 1-epimerase
VNEPSTRNHLHGVLHNAAWRVVCAGLFGDEVIVELEQQVDERSNIFEYISHPFIMTVRYTLSEQGLCQDVRIRNTGTESMPFMLAFHTTFNVPFDPSSTIADYEIQVTIGERWRLSDRMLPTGEKQPLSSLEEKMKQSGVNPFFEPMDNHYTAAPQNGRNFAALTDRRSGIRLVYDVGLRYKTWMIFNNYGRGGFICPEPQTCLVNAPNVNLPSAETGLIMLQPGETWSETSTMHVEVLSSTR